MQVGVVDNNVMGGGDDVAVTNNFNVMPSTPYHARNHSHSHTNEIAFTTNISRCTKPKYWILHPSTWGIFTKAWYFEEKNKEKFFFAAAVLLGVILMAPAELYAVNAWAGIALLLVIVAFTTAMIGWGYCNDLFEVKEQKTHEIVSDALFIVSPFVAGTYVIPLLSWMILLLVVVDGGYVGVQCYGIYKQPTADKHYGKIAWRVFCFALILFLPLVKTFEKIAEWSIKNDWSLKFNWWPEELKLTENVIEKIDSEALQVITALALIEFTDQLFKYISSPHFTNSRRSQDAINNSNDSNETEPLLSTLTNKSTDDNDNDDRGSGSEQSIGDGSEQEHVTTDGNNQTANINNGVDNATSTHLAPLSEQTQAVLACYLQSYMLVGYLNHEDLKQLYFQYCINQWSKITAEQPAFVITAAYYVQCSMLQLYAGIYAANQQAATMHSCGSVESHAWQRSEMPLQAQPVLVY